MTNTGPTDLPEQPHVEIEQTYTPDLDKISRANGDPEIWGHELYLLIGSITGKYISEGAIRGWLEAYGAQVITRTFRAAMFQTANTTLPMHLEGDPAIALLEFRTEIVNALKRQAL